MPYMAVQCFSCHQMQVKEVRKSSSSGRKWSCAICNEKQSVRKVFSSADTAKEVRKFVQQFNLTAGQAAHAEGISRLETGSPTEDSSYDYRYNEDEEGPMNGTIGGDDYAAQRRSFKWEKYLTDEEQVCSGAEFQQSSDDMRFTTTLPKPSSRRRTRPRSCSPPQKRPLRGFTTSRDDTDADPESFIPSDNRNPPKDNPLPDNSRKFQKGTDFGFEGSTPLGKPPWKFSTAAESTSLSSPTLDSDCSPKKVKSCHAQVSQPQTSKWSKYLS